MVADVRVKKSPPIIARMKGKYAYEELEKE
jgi:hypothetical protein